MSNGVGESPTPTPRVGSKRKIDWDRMEESRVVRQFDKHKMSEMARNVSGGINTEQSVFSTIRNDEPDEHEISNQPPAFLPGIWGDIFRPEYLNECRTQPQTANDDIRDHYNKLSCNTTKAVLIPTDSKRVGLIVASISQQEVFPGVSCSISQLAINPIIPSGSPVFDLVRRGNVQELRKMLQRGEASLKDHDEFGASLLMLLIPKELVKYSTRQPEMCKFLLESGLDVDLMGGSQAVENCDNNLLCTALLMEMNDLEEDEIMLHIINQCRQSLLEYGAGPTIKSEYGNCLFDRVNNDSAAESIQLAWNTELTGYFATVSSYRSSGPSGRHSSALHQICSNYGPGCQPESVTLLLELGAHIHARDAHGWTCLHTFIYSLHFVSKAEREVLEISFRRGVDIIVIRDNYGDTASDLAYYSISAYKDKVGSYPGDLWDLVSLSHGYNITSNRRIKPRRAVYAEWYRRADFESLWEGREHLCPYWDDQPWSPGLNDDMTSGKDTSEGESDEAEYSEDGDSGEEDDKQRCTCDHCNDRQPIGESKSVSSEDGIVG
ncbi:hypothetical protein BX600DRAFT_433023 [Xylariales sp. PMI_506]|nr:hypothetical protein BX600DRAFT_433023 [Xylariales sp. PMI_506]